MTLAEDQTTRVRPFQCPICKGQKYVRQTLHPGATWLPDVDASLGSEGWTKTAVLSGGKQQITLGGGAVGLVDVAQRIVALPVWTCGQGCARALATRAERTPASHQVDTPSRGEPAPGPAPFSAGEVRADVTRVTCPHCKASALLPVDAERRERLERATGRHGAYCSQTCAELAARAAGSRAPAPDLEPLLVRRAREQKARADWGAVEARALADLQAPPEPGPAPAPAPQRRKVS
jgi:hypothetical protein